MPINRIACHPNDLVDLIRYMAARDCITSLLDALPRLYLPDSNLEKITNNRLSDQCAEKMDIVNHLIGYKVLPMDRFDLEKEAEKNIIPFRYDQHDVRVIKNEEGEPWWVAKDICEILGVTTIQIRRLDEDEKGLRFMQTLGGPQELCIINESGLYTLILRSNKPQAKPFRKWVTSEVLPSLRRSGSYAMPKENLPATADARPSNSAYQALLNFTFKQVIFNNNEDARQIIKGLYEQNQPFLP